MLLGVGVAAVPAAFALGGAACFDWIDHGRALRWSALLIGLATLLPAFAALFAHDSGYELIALLPAGVAGWIGRTLALPFAALLGGFGALLALVVLGIALFVATIGWNPFGAGVRVLRRWRAARANDVNAASASPADVRDEADEPVLAATAVVTEREDSPAEPAATPSLMPALLRRRKERTNAHALEDTGDPHSTERPPLSLLSEPPVQNTALSEAELDRLGDVLVQTLRTFKVESQIAGRTTGPVVTQYEVVPAPGVKVNRIAALDADLALALRAPSIRIVAPIPGKGAVGVDVPNPEPEVVYLRRILETATFQKARGVLPLALGKDLTGRP
jgi:S-DNA-T family DNA segregation ATPase FtsK/SpoIIIE